MAREKSFLKTEVDIKEILKKERRMERESSDGVMGRYTKAISQTDKFMEEVN
jgi:hypothetical protein